jgi:hydroxymethylpyrimidine pyrophosphatase-like HAD family hydrolase
LLLFADLDGTLIVEPNGVGPKLLKLIEAVRRSGGELIPASARPMPHLAEMFEGDGPGSFAIGSGGATIARLGRGGGFEVLHEELLDSTHGDDYLALLWKWREEGRGIVFFFCGHQADFEVAVSRGSCELDPEELATIVGRRSMRRTVVPPAGGLLGVSLLAPCRPDRLFPLCSAELLPEGWRATVYPEYRVPGWSWLEVFSVRANKAEACRRVISLWRQEAGRALVTMAVGDATDDVGMFETVDVSFCPSDASKEARGAVSMSLPAPAGEDFAAALLAKVERREFRPSA